MTELQKMAMEVGFDHTAEIHVSDLEFNPDYRKYCEDNLCGNYNVLPACPPICGRVQEMKEKAQQYEKALILQTVWEVEDFNEERTLKKKKQKHNEMTKKLVSRFKEQGIQGLTMAAGPMGKDSCLSAYCIDARKMAETAGMEYWMGNDRIAYFTLFLHQRQKGED